MFNTSKYAYCNRAFTVTKCICWISGLVHIENYLCIWYICKTIWAFGTYGKLAGHLVHIENYLGIWYILKTVWVFGTYRKLSGHLVYIKCNRI